MSAATAIPKANLRHDIEAKLVQAQIAAAVARHEHRHAQCKRELLALREKYEQAQRDGTAHTWRRPPETIEELNAGFYGFIARERDHYALVRVIELPQPGKRFVLAYGDIDDAAVTRGTGPFGTFDEAAGWFLRGGR